MQLNLAMITVHFSYARRRKICRTDKLDVINKINEGPSAWWVNFVSETVIEELWRENFHMSRGSAYKLANELRLNSDTWGRENSIEYATYKLQSNQVKRSRR